MRDMPPNLMDYEKTYREFMGRILKYQNFGFSEKRSDEKEAYLWQM